ncbi:MAG: FecR domain-containing protein, partial [Sphingobacteriales bacterium]
MDSDEKSRLLARYTEGNASPEEREIVERWFATLQLPAQEWEQLPPDAQEVLLKGLYDNIQTIIRQDKVIPLPHRQWWRTVAAAAAILVFITAAWLFWPVKNTVQPLATLKAPASHLRFLRLPDSSSVWVNAGSQLKYPTRFGDKTREVYLSGEAYFDVRHKSGCPFIIHTGPVVTTVLGTAFDIREDPVTHQVTVMVRRGKVSVARGKQLAILLPDQEVSVKPQSTDAVMQKVRSAEIAAWRGGDLRFDNVAFADAVKQLEERFGVTIRFSNDKLKGCHFSASASADEPLDEVLKVMCSFNNATFSRQPDGNILISGE